MKELFISKKFNSNSMSIIKKANEIIDEYMVQGYTLTLRQLYYQFVSRALIENNQKSYKNLGSIINDARLAGLIDWDLIEDRTRGVHGSGGEYTNYKALMESSVKYGYTLDKWVTNDNYVEVWVEKDALISIVRKVCSVYEVCCLSCRGYVSQSEMYKAADRFKDVDYKHGKKCILLYLGDHDPSGIDMTRDIENRLNKVFGACVNVIRIALTMDQIGEYDPPPNFAKITDSRCKSYISNYGDESWELDALDPSVIDSTITDNILNFLDMEEFERIKKEEKRHIGLIVSGIKKMKGVDLE
jgi:hypothetical protein